MLSLSRDQIRLFHFLHGTPWVWVGCVCAFYLEFALRYYLHFCYYGHELYRIRFARRQPSDSQCMGYGLWWTDFSTKSVLTLMFLKYSLSFFRSLIFDESALPSLPLPPLLTGIGHAPRIRFFPICRWTFDRQPAHSAHYTTNFV